MKEAGQNLTFLQPEGDLPEMIPPSEAAPSIRLSTSRFGPEEITAFERDGFVIVRGLAPRELCEAMREAALGDLACARGPVEFEADLRYPGAPASRGAPGGATIRRLKEAHGRHVSFTRWASHPSLVVRLQQLLGRPVVMPLAHHNCVMTKDPRYSSQTDWHQDIRYWSFARPELVSVWLALAPEVPDNGGLWLVPGTHRMAFRREQLDQALFLRTDLPENRSLIERKIPARLEPGDVLFFHCQTMHAAGRNETGIAKLSVVFTFRALNNPPLPGSRSASMPELLLPVVE